MSLIKRLKSQNGQLKRKDYGQSVIEYIALFIVVAIGVIVVFGGFNPDRMAPSDSTQYGAGLNRVFNDTVTRAIGSIINWN